MAGASESGWNDPPRVSYQESQKQGTKKGLSLNKRPSYPSNAAPPNLSGELRPQNLPVVGNTKLHTSSTSLPPPPTSLTTPPVTTDDSTPHDCGDDPSPLDKQVILDYFTDTMKEKKSAMSDKQYTEINKRLDLLAGQWEEGKVSCAVHRKLSDLVTALQKDNKVASDTILVGLMVDHVNEVSQWMVAIKRLINT